MRDEPFPPRVRRVARRSRLGAPVRAYDARRRVLAWVALLGLAGLALVPAGLSYLAAGRPLLGVPSLVLAMPNNLTPFVEAGAMSGVFEGAPIGPALRAILADDRSRAEILRKSAEFMARYRVGSDGGAARRAAARIAGLVSGTDRPGRIS
jgi:hypothetical protein